MIHSLPYYIEAAQTNSPLIQDCLNQKEIQKQINEMRSRQQSTVETTTPFVQSKP